MRVHIYIYIFRCLQTKRAAVARLYSGIIPRVYVYIYDLLKYNENIRAGRGLIHFISSRTSRVFFYSRLDFTACGARVIIHFARRPLACKHIILYFIVGWSIIDSRHFKCLFCSSHNWSCTIVDFELGCYNT